MGASDGALEARHGTPDQLQRCKRLSTLRGLTTQPESARQSRRRPPPSTTSQRSTDWAINVDPTPTCNDPYFAVRSYALNK